jgi:hypothetical protein
MVSKAEALQGAIDTPLTSSRAAQRRATKKSAALGRAWRAWLNTTQFGSDRSRDLGRHTGARC